MGGLAGEPKEGERTERRELQGEQHETPAELDRVWPGPGEAPQSYAW
ncbi:hypothetical protein BQ8420_04500 [Nocardiopsis sp. JB363]|nr:hypothetical protein BQ8420_04500 [Nocardiopsis sp. JB363]